VDEAGSHPCIIGGVDFGGLLYAMFLAGWVRLFTIPLGLIIMLVWTVMFVTERKRNVRKLSHFRQRCGHTLVVCPHFQVRRA
jgi:hypothetical protein